MVAKVGPRKVEPKVLRAKKLVSSKLSQKSKKLVSRKFTPHFLHKVTCTVVHDIHNGSVV